MYFYELNSIRLIFRSLNLIHWSSRIRAWPFNCCVL